MSRQKIFPHQLRCQIGALEVFACLDTRLRGYDGLRLFIVNLEYYVIPAKAGIQFRRIRLMEKQTSLEQTR